MILAVVGVALAYISTGWFSPFADRTAETPQFEEPSDGSIEPIQPEVAEEEPENEGPIEGGPEVRDTLQAYSWTELSQISALIAAAPSDEEGIDIARRYNLCAESGSIDANNVKNLELSSGAVVPVAIGGFRHDAKSDGTGVSGITFITRASVGNQAVDPSGIATAWEETPLRSWLNQSLMAEIPAELAELVVPVNKTTNLPMAYGSGQSVTSEYLWIPSYSEVVGPLDSSNRRLRHLPERGRAVPALHRLRRDLRGRQRHARPGRVLVDQEPGRRDRLLVPRGLPRGRHPVRPPHGHAGRHHPRLLPLGASRETTAPRGFFSTRGALFCPAAWRCR